MSQCLQVMSTYHLPGLNEAWGDIRHFHTTQDSQRQYFQFVRQHT